MRHIIIFFVFTLLVSASEIELEQMIGRMLMVGFDQSRIDANSTIVKQMQRYHLGGVILFDRFFNDRNRSKNIENPQQLRRLTAALESYSPQPLLIALDQEGGRVQRLKSRDGFSATPSAKTLGAGSIEDAAMAYDGMGTMLHDAGINVNFAPVVDLAVNPDNQVIYALERSYGDEPLHVSRYAKTFMDAMHAHEVISVLKHFPGHGSSLGDSHKGFVDVSETWSEKELEPYRQLIADGDVQMIMTAHVFNRRLDATYPATLSYRTNTEILRKRLGFKGVIVSDDLQMKAIEAHYSLKETLTLAINAGVDMLLFGQQIEQTDVATIIKTIKEQVFQGAISKARIIEANRRIDALHVSRKIVDLPIDFDKDRIALTKAYIREHYGKQVKDITIDPKMIVLHWTAITDMNDSYRRLKPQLLYSDRKDIAQAGALNVSAHFLVDRDGTIYRLMPDNIMARHVIGLNYSAIGIENVGGENNSKEDLTQAQVDANIALVRYLKSRYEGIGYLIGHHEYLDFENAPLWLEKDKKYRTIKSDPGPRFMKQVRDGVADLDLKAR